MVECVHALPLRGRTVLEAVDMYVSGLGDMKLGVISLYKLLEAKTIHENAAVECREKKEVL